MFSCNRNAQGSERYYSNISQRNVSFFFFKKKEEYRHELRNRTAFGIQVANSVRDRLECFIH